MRLGAPGLTTRNKKLLGTKGIASGASGANRPVMKDKIGILGFCFPTLCEGVHRCFFKTLLKGHREKIGLRFNGSR